MHSFQVPEDIQNRVYQYLEPTTIDTDFIRSQKFFSLISEYQASTVKMLFSEEAIRMTHLFNCQDKDSHIKFFVNNMEMNVYLIDDVIIKQGDLAGPDAFFYIIVEGFAEVIQEKVDFCYFDSDSTKLFLTDKEEEYDIVEKSVIEWLDKSSIDICQSDIRNLLNKCMKTAFGMN